MHAGSALSTTGVTAGVITRVGARVRTRVGARGLGSGPGLGAGLGNCNLIRMTLLGRQERGVREVKREREKLVRTRVRAQVSAGVKGAGSDRACFSNIFLWANILIVRVS